MYIMRQTCCRLGRDAVSTNLLASSFIPNSIMTKTKLIEEIARGTGLSKQETEAVLSGFTETVKEALSNGEPVDIRGFGSFRVQERAARNARNLATGEIMRVEAKKVPVFKPSREFKDRVMTRNRE